jgi:hypothetical protein
MKSLIMLLIGIVIGVASYRFYLSRPSVNRNLLFVTPIKPPPADKVAIDALIEDLKQNPSRWSVTYDQEGYVATGFIKGRYAAIYETDIWFGPGSKLYYTDPQEAFIRKWLKEHFTAKGKVKNFREQIAEDLRTPIK